METMQEFTLEFEGVFHNVGQGLFYSGEIIQGKNSFNFVYDCGSIWNNGKTNIRYLKPAIQRYVSSLKNRNTLHLLVISHLHSDHVNGLPILLDNFSQVKVAILPYFSPIERLIVALNNINSPVWYFEFLAEPAIFLLNRNVEKVIFITRNGEGGEPLVRPPGEGPDNNFSFPVEELPEGKPTEAEDYPEKFKKKIYYKLSGVVGLSYSFCREEPIWEFAFFNYKGSIEDKHLKEFENCLNSIKGEKNLVHIIRNKDILREIKEKCYSKLVEQGNLKNFNNTSLVLFHRPLNFYSLNYNAFTHFLQLPLVDYIALRPLFKPICYKKNVGTLLLGDIDLNQSLNELKRFLKERLKTICFALIPHHGSKYNWKKDILEKEEIFLSVWVASAGTYNIYGHPSFKVFRDLIKKYCIPIWCSENNAFIYWFELKIKL